MFLSTNCNIAVGTEIANQQKLFSSILHENAALDRKAKQGKKLMSHRIKGSALFAAGGNRVLK